MGGSARRDPSALPKLRTQVSECAEAPLILLLAIACRSSTPHSLAFAATLNGQPVACGEEVPVGEHRVVVRDLRFFVHDVHLVEGEGEFPLVMDETPWQHDGVALVDLETGCHNGTEATHARVTGLSAAVEPDGVRFTLGVPFDANHADPMRAVGPLTTTGMHWGWQGGHKFFRADLMVDGQPRPVHLGSTGCVGTIGAIESCAHPNRFAVESDGMQITVELAPLVEASAACMGRVDDAGCDPLFAALEGRGPALFRRRP